MAQQPDIVDALFNRIDFSKIERDKLTPEEGAAIAQMGVFGTGFKAGQTIRAAYRAMIRSGKNGAHHGIFEYAFDQKGIDRLKKEYTELTGDKVTFWPEAMSTVRGAATTLLTLGFNSAVNAVKEAKLCNKDLAAQEEVKRKVVEKNTRALGRLLTA